LESASSATGQQELIKFKSSYAVADGLTVVSFYLGPAHATGAKSGDWLKDAALRIFNGIYLKFLDYGRRDPSTADFVPREYALVEDKDVET
jgi:hypothetical protein